MTTINIHERFKQEVCTFAASKRAKAAGMTCANTFFAYDDKGVITDGGWMEKLGFNDFFPCITFPFACGMLDNCPIETDLFKFTTDEKGTYTIEYKNDRFVNQNIVDVMVDFWAKYKGK